VVFVIVTCEAVSVSVTRIEITVIVSLIEISIKVAGIAVAVVVSSPNAVLNKDNIISPQYPDLRCPVLRAWDMAAGKRRNLGGRGSLPTAGIEVCDHGCIPVIRDGVVQYKP
jgi:hypothetical protein